MMRYSIRLGTLTPGAYITQADRPFSHHEKRTARINSALGTAGVEYPQFGVYCWFCWQGQYDG